MRTAVEMNDPCVVDHFDMNDQGVAGLNNLITIAGARGIRRVAAGVSTIPLR